jgi:transcription elongation factor GreA
MDIKVTKDGLEALKKELSVLVEEKRPRIVERLSNARSQGDLSENSDYQSAREELEFLDGRIDEIQEVMKRAQVVSNNGHNGSVGVGTKVTLKVNGSDQMFDIVGEWEADPVNKKISHTSPLGVALLGKKKGERVEVEAPAGKVLYEILRIE